MESEGKKADGIFLCVCNCVRGRRKEDLPSGGTTVIVAAVANEKRTNQRNDFVTPHHGTWQSDGRRHLTSTI
jgi:hypothetical protein